MKRLICIGFLLSLWLASCTPESYVSMSSESNLAPSQFASVLETPSPAISQVACAQVDLPIRPLAQATSLVANLNSLGIDLYHTQTQNNDNNLIFSPYGVVSAFSAAYAGARDETEAEMAQVLQFLPQSEQHDQYRMVNCYLAGLANDAKLINPGMGEQNIPFQLQLANGLWRQQGFPLSPGFLTTIADKYAANLQEVNFVTNSAQAVAQINQWVDQATAGRIQELVTQNEVTPNTRLVIANAIYFKASWLAPFSLSRTEMQPFILLSSDQIEVPLMHNTMRAPYLKAEGYQAALLPYFVADFNKGVEMLIILPDSGQFTHIEQNLTTAEISQIAAEAEVHDITLTLPRFEVQNRLNLVKELQAMGLQAPFDSAQANFAGMTDGPNGLYISAAIQQATITVDENGTEAAAATGVVMPVSKLEPAELNVNRPFIYAIREADSGAILFMGRVMNPVE